MDELSRGVGAAFFAAGGAVMANAGILGVLDEGTAGAGFVSEPRKVLRLEAASADETPLPDDFEPWVLDIPTGDFAVVESTEQFVRSALAHLGTVAFLPASTRKEAMLDEAFARRYKLASRRRIEKRRSNP